MLMAAMLAARTQPRLAQAVQVPMPRRPRVRWSRAWPATARRALAQRVTAQALPTLARRALAQQALPTLARRPLAQQVTAQALPTLARRALVQQVLTMQALAQRAPG
jgi:hypothetical protein